MELLLWFILAPLDVGRGGRKCGSGVPVPRVISFHESDGVPARGEHRDGMGLENRREFFLREQQYKDLYKFLKLQHQR